MALDNSSDITPVSKRTAVAAGVVAVIWMPCSKMRREYIWDWISNILINNNSNDDNNDNDDGDDGDDGDDDDDDSYCTAPKNNSVFCHRIFCLFLFWQFHNLFRTLKQQKSSLFSTVSKDNDYLRNSYE
jgi:hypothetical protein